MTPIRLGMVLAVVGGMTACSSQNPEKPVVDGELPYAAVDVQVVDEDAVPQNAGLLSGLLGGSNPLGGSLPIPGSGGSLPFPGSLPFGSLGSNPLSILSGASVPSGFGASGLPSGLPQQSGIPGPATPTPYPTPYPTPVPTAPPPDNTPIPEPGKDSATVGGCCSTNPTPITGWLAVALLGVLARRR